MKRLRPALALMLLWLMISSCQKDYCIQCVDPTGARPPVTGCRNDLDELELSRTAFEAEGFVCIIFNQ
jgi:hypothetical protein